MGISTRVRAGAKGTKKLVRQYGDKLICVRYRYDEASKKRYKTIELIIDEVAWERKARRYKPQQVVGVRVGMEEQELQKRVKQAGGRWNKEERVWEIRYDRAVSIGVKDRIARGKFMNGKT